MFLENKYTKYYNAIINSAKQSSRLRKDAYFENHHIMPKSCGGTNEKENLVLLTAREHFVCHMLLPKMFEKNSLESNKMLHAIMLFKGENEYQHRYINSRLYELIKKDFSKAISKRLTGRTLSEEHKKNISKALLGRKGYKMSEETKKVISDKAKKRKRKPFTDEYKAKMSTIMKERHRWKKNNANIAETD